MRLSICMMVKNEEKNLPACLTSLQELRGAVESELIIIDTGSEDRTVEIAKQFTDKVYFHPWANDFSAMRNKTIEYAQGEWILIVDADEILNNTLPLIKFLHSAERKKFGVVAVQVKNYVKMDSVSFSTMVSLRLFKNDGYFCYEGAVHNQPRFRGETMAFPEVVIDHYGYIEYDEELMERKFLRTSAILKSELEKDPENVYYWTQLSVTYAMHKEYPPAIEAAEKAYSLIPEPKTMTYMFALLQLILMYQHTSQYEKVVKLCREALAIRDGYLDVYYYYAEALAHLKQYQEAIVYYEKYLAQLDRYDAQPERDISIIEYTLGCRDVVYYNLSQVARECQLYDKAVSYAERVETEKYRCDNIANVIELYVKKIQFAKLRNYYETKLPETAKADFCNRLSIQMAQSDEYTRRQIAAVFRDEGSEFGLMCRMLLELAEGGLTPHTLQAALQLRLETLPIYCAEIVYYLLKAKAPLAQMIGSAKEQWFVCIMEHVVKTRSDIREVLYEYLEQLQQADSFAQYKMVKLLARMILLLNGLAASDWMAVFTRYVRMGIVYLETIYRAEFLTLTNINELKNDEEAFLLFMRLAESAKGKNHQEYVKYLRLALQAFPEMKAGIEQMLLQMQSVNQVEQNEMEEYKVQIKAQISELIAQGQMTAARTLLEEYKAIVPGDLEAILLESKIFLS